MAEINLIDGTIRNFTSTGIKDSAHGTELNIKDRSVVVENKLVSKELEVSTDAIIKGDLIVKGKIPLSKNTTDALVETIVKNIQPQLSAKIGNNLKGITISNFSSTGIEDLARFTELTVMDRSVVVENKLVSKKLEVLGDTVIEGDLTVKGKIPLNKKTTGELVDNILKKLQPILSSKIDNDLKEISGNRIIGGTISNFSSTGIEDRAEDVQLTIMNNMIVFENKLVAKSLEVKGDTIIDGNLVIKGDVPLDANTTNKLVKSTADLVVDIFDSEIKNELSSGILKQIREGEIDAAKLTVNGRNLLINDNSIAPHIRNSSLTTIGHLKELQVTGETLLSGSLYTSTAKRVGVNTTEPVAALSIWDQEVEVIVSKHKDHTSFIGSIRRQDVILSSAGKENIILTSEGEAVISKLVADKTLFSSASAAPNVEGSKGDVVFNTEPKLGGPWGWMCLGGARWAIMGTLA